MSTQIDANDPLRIQRSEDDEKNKKSTKRTEAEPPSPSKQGQFLSALERKDRPVKKEGEEKEVPKGLFQVIQPKEEPSSEGEGQEQEFEGEGKKFEGEPIEQPGKLIEKPTEKPMTTGPSTPMVAAASRYVGATTPPVSGKPEAKVTQSKSKIEKEKGVQKKEEPVTTGQRIVHPPILGLAETRRPDTSIEDQKGANIHLQALVKECVSAIQTLVSKGQTTSVVTLKYPPLFEGSTLTVTEFATAKKEFNITFADLSPDARRLIEVTANQEQLRQNLVEKGYALHMITIEAPSKPISTAATETHTETGSHKRGAESQQETETQSSTDLV